MRWRIAGAVLLSAIGLAACGGSDEPTESAAAGTSASTPEASQALLDALQRWQKPQELRITQPIGKPIPADKTVTFVTCVPQGCLTAYKGFEQAAKVLGWKTKVVTTGATPAEIQGAFEQVIRDKPDAVINSGNPQSIIDRQLQTLADMKIPVIMASVTDPPDPAAQRYVLPNNVSNQELGERAAAMVAGLSDGPANVMIVNIAEYAVIDEAAKATKAELEKACSECEADIYDMPITSVGKDSAQRIVSYLQGHPDVNAVLDTQGSLVLGLPAALQGAGIPADKVKLFVNSPDFAVLPMIESGEVTAASPYPYVELGYTEADALSRIFTGQDPSPATEVPMPGIIWTAENLPGTEGLQPVLPDPDSAFRKLWDK